MRFGCACVVPMPRRQPTLSGASMKSSGTVSTGAVRLSVRRGVLALLATFVLTLSGCQPNRPAGKAGPPQVASDQALESVRSTYPGALVGRVISGPAELLVGIGDVPLQALHEGDLINFMTSDGSTFNHGRVVERGQASVIVRFDDVGGRAP